MSNYSLPLPHFVLAFPLMTRRLSVSLSKGGVGKTTSVANLSAGLATAGKKVLAIDLDTQGQLTKIFGIKPQYGLIQKFGKNSPPKGNYLVLLGQICS